MYHEHEHAHELIQRQTHVHTRPYTYIHSYIHTNTLHIYIYIHVYIHQQSYKPLLTRREHGYSCIALHVKPTRARHPLGPQYNLPSTPTPLHTSHSTPAYLHHAMHQLLPPRRTASSRGICKPRNADREDTCPRCYDSGLPPPATRLHRGGQY